MVPTTNNWAIEKGASIVRMFLKGQKYLGGGSAGLAGGSTDSQHHHTHDDREALEPIAAVQEIASALNSVAENNARLPSYVYDKFKDGGDDAKWNKRIAPSLQSALLRASADYVTHEVPDASKTKFLDFLKSKKEQCLSHAQHVLVAKRMSSQAIDQPFAMALWGAILYNAGNSNKPKGISIFLTVPVCFGEGEDQMGQEEQDLRIANNLMSEKEIIKMAVSKPRLLRDANKFKQTFEKPPLPPGVCVH
jgi:hypothetical protein